MWPFKHPAKSEVSVLPEEVAQAIESAHLLTRSSRGDDDAPRVLVSMPGRRFFADMADEAIRARWPELNSVQHRRACNWIASRVAFHLRNEAQAGSGSTPRWRDWKPAPRAFED